MSGIGAAERGRSVAASYGLGGAAGREGQKRRVLGLVVVDVVAVASMVEAAGITSASSAASWASILAPMILLANSPMPVGASSGQ
jgi:hypothetical protein